MEHGSAPTAAHLMVLQEKLLVLGKSIAPDTWDTGPLEYGTPVLSRTALRLMSINFPHFSKSWAGFELFLHRLITLDVKLLKMYSTVFRKYCAPSLQILLTRFQVQLLDVANFMTEC